MLDSTYDDIHLYDEDYHGGLCPFIVHYMTSSLAPYFLQKRKATRRDARKVPTVEDRNESWVFTCKVSTSQHSL